MRSERAQWWVAASAAGLLLAIAVMPLIPPGARGGDDRGATFDVDVAMSHVEVIARGPHPMGSAENARVRESIIDSLETMGLEPELQQLTPPDYYGGSGTVQAVNVMVRIPGRAPTGAVALVGHYDSSPTTPGANDNAAAVAVLLESARVILAGEQLRNDVILLFTDGEEPAPRYGSTAFVEGHPWASEIAAVVNLEAIGGSGPSMVVATNGPETWLIDAYAKGAPAPVAHSYLTSITRLIGGSNTDFAPFRDRGVAGIEFVYLHDSPIYHTDEDAPGQVGRRSLYQHGTNALAMVRHLAEADLADLPDPSTGVFFTVGPHLVVRYPEPVSAVIAVLAGVLLLAAGVRIRRSSRLSLSSLLRGAGVTIAGLFGSLLFGALAWMAYAAARPSPGMVESYLVLAVMVGLVTTMATLGRRRLARQDGGAFAVVATWWLLALATGFLVPGMSYLFGWPSLAGALWLTMEPSNRLPVAATWFAAVTGAAFVVTAPAIDTFFQFAQPRPGNTDSQLIPLAGISTALAFLVAALVAAAWPPGRRSDVASPRIESAEPTRVSR